MIDNYDLFIKSGFKTNIKTKEKKMKLQIEKVNANIDGLDMYSILKIN